MSNPEEQQREPEELDLDAEEVKDLEPDEQSSQDVHGGAGYYVSGRPQVCL
jgi:hypothetical protein